MNKYFFPTSTSPPRGHVGGLVASWWIFVLIMALSGHRNTATTKKLDFENSHLTSVGAANYWLPWSFSFWLELGLLFPTPTGSVHATKQRKYSHKFSSRGPPPPLMSILSCFSALGTATQLSNGRSKYDPHPPDSPLDLPCGKFSSNKIRAFKGRSPASSPICISPHQ